MGEVSQMCSDVCAWLVSQASNPFLTFYWYHALKHYRIVKKIFKPLEEGQKNIEWDFILGDKEKLSSSSVDNECIYEKAGETTYDWLLP